MTIPPIMWALLALGVLIIAFELVRFIPGVSGTQAAGFTQFMIGAAAYVQGMDLEGILGSEAVPLVMFVNGLLIAYMRTRTSQPGKLS